MNNLEKMLQLLESVIKIERFPVVYRSERENEDNILKFFDGTDMAIFFEAMTKKYKNNKLSIQERFVYERLITIKKLLRYKNHNKYVTEKLNEAREISIKKGYRPVSNYSNNGNLELSSKFNDGVDVGNFIEYCKRKLENNSSSKEIEEAYNNLLQSTISYQTYLFSKKINTIKDVIKNQEFIPVTGQKNSDKNKCCSFDDGTDMGFFIANNQQRYESNIMSEEKKKIWEEFLEYKEDFKKHLFVKKIMKMYNTIIETNNIIPWDENKDKDIYKFVDGTKMYNFISATRDRIKQQKASKFEAWLFNKFIDFQARFKFKLRAKEALENIIKLERYPTEDGKNRNQRYVRKFNDGYDIGLWLRRIFKKVRKGNIEKNLLPIAEELMNLDFEEIKKWNYGYNQLKEYYNNNYSNEYNLNNFIEENKKVYKSQRKSIQDEIHMAMLTNLNPNWCEEFISKTSLENKSLIKKLRQSHKKLT